MPEPRSLAEATDQAIDRANAAALAADPDGARARENGARWAAWLAAERAAGPHAAILPIATARDVLAILEGREPVLDADLVRKLVLSAIDRTDARTATQE